MGKKLKQKAAKFAPPRNRNAFNNHNHPSTKTSTGGSNSPRPYFSLRDELSNTEKHRSEWTPQTRLRDQKIGFVSAGTMAPLDEPKVDHGERRDITVQDDYLSDAFADSPDADALDNTDTDLLNSENAMAQMHIDSQELAEEGETIEMDIETTTHVHADVVVPNDDLPIERLAPQSPPPTEQPAFFIDTEGDQALAFKGPKSVPAPRAPSPARSTSSDEVVLFRGRAGVTVRDDPVVKPAPQLPAKPASAKSDPKPASQPPSTTTNPYLKSLQNPPEWAHQLQESEPSNEFSSQPVHDWPTVESALGFTNRLDEDLSGVRASRKSKKSRKKQNAILRRGKNFEDELMQDYIQNMDKEDMRSLGIFQDDDSDSDSTDDVFEQLLNDEEQDGDDVDVTALDDEWSDEDSSIEGSEEVDDDDEDSSDLEERLERAERERWEDDEDLRERTAAAMEDEELARYLAKQEELGLGGDDIVIYDDRFGDVGAARAGLAEYSVKTPSGGRKKKNRKSDHFPDATLLADVLEDDPYGGFDVMDFDRPSLRRKSKGRKSAGPLPEELAGLSDDDLIEDLQNQWANDRSRKAQKKAEREELRQLGLLGKKNKFKPDLNQRYSEGITMVQLKFELREFLEQEDHSTKAFPPMAKADRKVLHEIANHFKLKSKSVGSGKNRAPVLIKSSQTFDWSEERFTRVSGFVSRGYLKNSSKKTKSNFATEARRGRQAGGGGTNAASYRNGDIVGQHASEIPASNFGRKLMERMGWSAGMSLGKEGNSGLLVPVEAKIKSGKAGLG